MHRNIEPNASTTAGTAASGDGAASAGPSAAGELAAPRASAAPGESAAPSEATAPAEPANGAFSPDQARLVLRRVKDPELNLNIVDLGLIYDVTVAGSDVRVDMSLTSPGCPSGPEIMGEAEKELRTIPGVGEVVVNLVWSPAWTPDRIEPRVRAYMGF
jgi:metal-sulfur cluster biosynthetic enzyme